MPRPWDPLPYPAIADEDFEHTYTGVGAALSEWESIEFTLARIYSIFAGDPDGDSLREYGQGRISRDRIAILGAKAEQYFIANPSQAHEGEVKRIVTHVTGFAERRNEIAHGIVMDVRNITYFKARMPLMKTTSMCALLVPPWHSLRHHEPNGEPSYAYNRTQLFEMARRLLTLQLQADAFRKALLVQARRRP